MISLKTTITIIFFLFISKIKGQTLNEIIEYHKLNSQNLRVSRGANPNWGKTDGEVTLESLINLLESYNEKNVAILIYNHQNDTLTLNLISKKGLVATLNNKIKREEIINKVNNVSTLFTSKLSENIAGLRGSNPIDTESRILELEKLYTELNNLLLPNSFNLETYNHIIFVPIYNLSTLPFSAFKLNNEYLIDTTSFSIAPSLFELMVSKNINSSENYDYDKIYYHWDNALFIANPKYPKDSDLNFPDLPGAMNEVEQISKSLSPESYKIFTGTDATKSKIKENICDYDLLYFATHGVSNSENPLDQSYIVLAGDKNTALFTAREIMNLRNDCQLKADLVVLSACQTGLGKSHEGGIIGLARAFQIAGANHILMSLWSINDVETAKLMVLFFEELKVANYLQPHESLRNAILKYKKEVNKDPKYWASFSIFGIPY